MAQIVASRGTCAKRLNLPGVKAIRICYGFRSMPILMSVSAHVLSSVLDC